jgi:carbonic anhydrase
MKTTRNILLGVLLVVVCFVSGCQMIHGAFKDGETAFGIAERITRPLAEGQDKLNSRMKEEDLHRQLSKAEKEIVEAHERTERFAQRDPMRAAEK